MGTEISRPNGNVDAPTSVEVEFALVLSRVIQSVKDDPEQLRDVVYELARRKLQEQFSNEDTKDVAALTNALELAIRGVEDFSRKNPLEETPRRSRPYAISSSIMESPRLDETYGARPDAALMDAALPSVTQPRDFRKRGPRFSAPWRYLTVVAIVAVSGALIAGRTVIFDFVQGKGKAVGTAAIAPLPTAAPIVEQREPSAAAQTAARLLPTSYGIYALSEEKLYELELLPGRAPDMRVAISPAIATPSRVTLPDGQIKFVVFRRDSASNAADRAEVRVIAKIKQAVSFDAAGKQLVTKADDAWVIRNISQPYRTAPINEHPDMYEIQGENSEAALVPGRYALVLKGQVYDFSVAGPITDVRQCLERLSASNGVFYTECPKQ